MSHHTEIVEKNTEDEILLYLNGFFCAMEILNSYVNDSKTMYVERIQKQLDETRPAAIKRHLNEPNYKVELEPIGNFQERLSAQSLNLFGILEASDGSIWFGAVVDVYRYDGNTITDFKGKKVEK